MGKRLESGFYMRDVLQVAPDLLGQTLVRVFEDGKIRKYTITEVEAYRGEKDLACHASKGRTTRTEVMYGKGGHLYVYLIYGMYWMLNVVTASQNIPQAVLIRGLDGLNGPGRLTRELHIDKRLNGECLNTSKRIWIENSGIKPHYRITPRVNVEYAGEVWSRKEWRFLVVPKMSKVN